MIGCRARRRIRRWRSWSWAVALLVAVAFGMKALPISPEPPGATMAQGACWFEPINVCDTDTAVSRLLADIPVLPPAAVDVAADPGAQPVPSAPPQRLPAGFAPAVYHPPRHSS
jgi:hypothetical protein